MSDPIRDARRARRLARVLFSDLAAYAGDQLRLGLEKDDLFTRLAPDIARARDFYHSRVDPELPEAERILDFALVDILIYGSRRIASHIW